MSGKAEIEFMGLLRKLEREREIRQTKFYFVLFFSPLELNGLLLDTVRGVKESKRNKKEID